MSFVYFIQDRQARLIKIGCTADCPYVRLNQLRRARPGSSLEILGVISIELGQTIYEKTAKRDLQARFEQLRENGDWLRPGRELMNFISENAGPHFCSRSCPDGTSAYEERLADQEAAAEAIARAMTGIA